QTEKRDLQISAYLHDIGKVGITNTYIFKDGPLDEDEWAAIREHPIKGVKIVAPLKLPYEVIAGIKHHHERFDGKGYPEGLMGKQIPLFARIIAIADSYDAMTVGRPYRAPLSKGDAMLELKRNSSSQFDRELVDVFSKEMKKK
ncbi:MAG: HD domain-containing protein, partial [Deltaproteobacteria bacterium]|nr:HD domain-containing protein [Deltaproteobacteria bacterium]